MNLLKIIKKAFQMKRYLFLLTSLLILSLTGCEYFENSDTQNISSLEVNISGLPAIPDTMTYVGWFDSDNDPPVFAFDMDADGSGNINYKSDKPLGELQLAQLFILTIERKSALDDSGFTASSRLVLSGRFKTGLCNLEVGEGAGDFSKSSAIFSLATPTDGAGTNELSGVWFVDSLNAGGPVAGLNLPPLYSTWIYEGWIEINGTLVSTGRFTDPKAADLFNGYSGAGTPYPFPGEDFLNNAPAGLTFPTDLSGQKVYVSLENLQRPSTAPFKILFSATLPSPAQSGVSYQMERSTDIAPSGNAAIVVDLLE